MRILPLRTSLKLWFVGLATGMITLAAAALFVGMRSALLRGLDATLMARAEGIGSMCEWEDGAIELEGALEQSLDSPLSRNVAGVELRTWPELELVRAHGESLPPRIDIGASTVSGRRIVAHVMTLPGSEHLTDDGSESSMQVLVRVTDSLGPVQVALLWLGGFALVTLGVALLTALGFGSYVGRRIVKPLGDLADAAAAVRPGVSAQLPRRGVDDELDRLAAVLQATFDALKVAMDEQRRFTADASHELRTPIAILQAETEIALRRERSPAELTDLIVRVQGTAARMGRMVESLLTLTRLDEGLPIGSARVDLTHLIDDIVAQSCADVSIEIQTLRAAGPCSVPGDEELLRMLLANLLANACRYARTVVRVWAEEVGGGVDLVVEDDGAGVGAAERERLFERFYRGMDARGHAGAGLGLALVASIARAHGGSTSAEDVVPGLRIRVRLPA
jgi:signal transduction histidine kinase